MRKVRNVVVLSLTVLMSLSLLACGKSNKSIVGTWVYEKDQENEQTMIFNEDGTGKMSSGGIEMDIKNYKTDDNKLTIEIELLGESQTDEYTYELKDTSLELTKDGETKNYNKQ